MMATSPPTQMRTSHPDESKLMFLAHLDSVDLRGRPAIRA